MLVHRDGSVRVLIEIKSEILRECIGAHNRKQQKKSLTPPKHEGFSAEFHQVSRGEWKVSSEIILIGHLPRYSIPRKQCLLKFDSTLRVVLHSREQIENSSYPLSTLSI